MAGLLPPAKAGRDRTEAVDVPQQVAVAGIGEPLIGRLLLYDSLGTRFTELKVRRDPECPICGDNAPEIPESEMGKFPDYEAFCAA